MAGGSLELRRCILILSPDIATAWIIYRAVGTGGLRGVHATTCFVRFAIKKMILSVLIASKINNFKTPPPLDEVEI